MPHVNAYHNGKRLVSVTELTKIVSLQRWDVKRKRTEDGLTIWRRDMCQCTECHNTNRHDYKGKYLRQGVCGQVLADECGKEAADLGNSIHKDIENWFKGQEASTTWGKKIAEQFKAADVKAFLHSPEEALKDEESGLAGSPDHVIDGKWESYQGVCIGDLKVKNSLDALTGMQGMGYRYLLKRKYKVDVKWMLVTWCKKKTVSQIVEPVWIDLDRWVEPWKHLVGLWNVINPSRKVTVFE